MRKMNKNIYEECSDLKNDMEDLLCIICLDKDGSYFICEDNKEFIDSLYKKYGSN